MKRAISNLPGIAGEPLRLGLSQLRSAAELAASHGLTLYDASYWSAAQWFGGQLVTMDAELLAVGAGETPAEACERLGL